MYSEKSFFELLQVAVGNRDRLSVTPSDEEWQELYATANKQSLTGIAFAGIEHLPEEQRPEEILFLRWTGMASKIRERNLRMNDLSHKLCERFEHEGFQVAVLKGQANLRYYPEALRLYRSSGDIDAWILNSKVKKIIEYCLGMRPGETPYYHHINFPVIPDAEVEVHYRPAWLSSPFLNRKLQRWFREHQDTTQYEGFPVTSDEMNVVFQLLHIYRHLFQEGIGLRQLLDYFVVVQSAECKVQSYSTIRELRVDEFCAAVMWVLGEVFGLQKEDMLCEPDPKRGEHLLREIMRAGNFGQYDERNGDFIHESHARRFWRKTLRSARLARLYPHEALWEPLFSIYHLLWRGLKLWKWE